MPQQIVFYHSAMMGAPNPAHATANGSLLQVLDACLVDGFNGIALLTLTQIAGTASAQTNGAHKFSIGDWIEILGATPSGYNGRFKVLTASSNAFTFAVDSALSTPATGAITARHPPAGWNRMDLANNTKAYQGGAGSLGLWMQIEDNNQYGDAGLSFRTRMARGLTALDEGTVVQSQMQQQKYAGGWMLFADHKTCYLFMGPLGGTTFFSFCFGEFDSYLAGDQYSMFSSAGRFCSNANAYDSVGAYVGFATWGGQYWPAVTYHTFVGTAEGGAAGRNMRSYQQSGPTCNMDVPHLDPYHKLNGVPNVWMTHYTSIPAPSVTDNAVPMMPLLNVEWSASGGAAWRGRFRGIYRTLANLGAGGFVNSFMRIDDAVIEGETRRMVVMRWIPWTREAQYAFPIDGTWG